MKKYLAIISFVISFNTNLQAQLKITDSLYTTFGGIVRNVYIIEGTWTVLNIDRDWISPSQLTDTGTLTRILYRCDSLYEFYKTNLGYEPSGGNPNYSNKCNVFFGAPSCGSGCGLIGSKGVEIGFFSGIFDNLKYRLNNNQDVIVGYEFGRNFLTFGSKILFPSTAGTEEKNGGWAEAFAQLFASKAFDKIITSPDERIFNETIKNLYWNYKNFIGYINDTAANPYNTFAKWDIIGIRDMNRGIDEGNNDAPTWIAGSVLQGIISTFGDSIIFPTFFLKLRQLPNVTTIEDALSNIALATALSNEKNVAPFFKNVLKFNLNPAIESEILKKPKIENKLIKYENTLWFTTPFETIRLNLRSVNYLSEGERYRIIIDNSIYSESANGNNEIPYSVLKNRDSVKANCLLINNTGAIADSFDVILRKRHNVRLLNYPDDLFAYYTANKVTKSNLIDKTLILSSVDTTLDNGLVNYYLSVNRNRLIKISCLGKRVGIPYQANSSYNFGIVTFTSTRQNGTRFSSGRLGLDFGRNDTLNYYPIWSYDSTQSFMPQSTEKCMLRIAVNSISFKGLQTLYIKDLIFQDLTDTDGDGIIDFEDNCPTIKNIKPSFNTSKYSFCTGDSLKLSITNVNKGDTLKWYFGTKSDLTNVANKTFTDSSKVYVTRTDSLGCIISSDTIQIKKYSIPGSPTLLRDSVNNLVASINGITWYKDGVKIADTTQKFKPTSNGIYTATTTQNGCTSSISQGYYYLTNAISNLSNGEFFKISPNPTSGELNINYRFSSNKDVYISIIDMNGRNLVLNRKINSGSKINLGNVSKGNYIIQIKDKTGRLITSQKVVKE